MCARVSVAEEVVGVDAGEEGARVSVAEEVVGVDAAVAEEVVTLDAGEEGARAVVTEEVVGVDAGEEGARVKKLSYSSLSESELDSLSLSELEVISTKLGIFLLLRLFVARTHIYSVELQMIRIKFKHKYCTIIMNIIG